jgi:hypothetical protein
MRLMMELHFDAFTPEADSDAAVAALQQAGFVVFRFPIKLRHLLEHPCDDLIQVTAEGPPGACPQWQPPTWPSEIHDALDKFDEAVSAVIEPYGATMHHDDPIPTDFVPFSNHPKWSERWTGDWKIEEKRKQQRDMEARALEKQQQEKRRS